jgi:hypothetical protein
MSRNQARNATRETRKQNQAQSAKNNTKHFSVHWRTVRIKPADRPQVKTQPEQNQCRRTVRCSPADCPLYMNSNREDLHRMIRWRKIQVTGSSGKTQEQKHRLKISTADRPLWDTGPSAGQRKQAGQHEQKTFLQTTKEHARTVRKETPDCPQARSKVTKAGLSAPRREVSDGKNARCGPSANIMRTVRCSTKTYSAEHQKSYRFLPADCPR